MNVNVHEKQSLMYSLIIQSSQRAMELDRRAMELDRRAMELDRREMEPKTRAPTCKNYVIDSHFD